MDTVLYSRPAHLKKGANNVSGSLKITHHHLLWAPGTAGAAQEVKLAVSNISGEESPETTCFEPAPHRTRLARHRQTSAHALEQPHCTFLPPQYCLFCTTQPSKKQQRRGSSSSGSCQRMAGQSPPAWAIGAAVLSEPSLSLFLLFLSGHPPSTLPFHPPLPPLYYSS